MQSRFEKPAPLGGAICVAVACVLVCANSVGEAATTDDASTSSSDSGRDDGPLALDLNKASVRFVLDARRGIYDITVAWEYATTIWLPVSCREVNNGNPTFFVLNFDKDALDNRRYTLTPRKSKAEDPNKPPLTSVSFDCDQGVAFVLRARQGPASEAALTVQFAFDPAENARVRIAVRAERERLAAALDAERSAMRKEAKLAAQREFLQEMLRRFSVEDDVEYARKNFVIAKVFREVLVGGRGNILFQIKNHTDSDVTIQGVEVVEEDGGRVLGGTLLAMTDRRVVAGESVLAAVGFDAPADLRSLKLVIQEDGPRTIEVEDIEF